MEGELPSQSARVWQANPNKFGICPRNKETVLGFLLEKHQGSSLELELGGIFDFPLFIDVINTL